MRWSEVEWCATCGGVWCVALSGGFSVVEWLAVEGAVL